MEKYIKASDFVLCHLEWELSKSNTLTKRRMRNNLINLLASIQE